MFCCCLPHSSTVLTDMSPPALYAIVKHHGLQMQAQYKPGHGACEAVQTACTSQTQLTPGDL